MKTADLIVAFALAAAAGATFILIAVEAFAPRLY